MVAEGLEVGHDLVRELEGRLAPRPDDAAAGPLLDGLVDRLEAHLMPAVELGVAEAAAQVALTQANEDRGLAHVHALALQAVEYLVDDHVCLYTMRLGLVP